ncbi:hypothetical protein B0T25DRAFT_561713 [Lasiosphaeria hispida]|uniref:Uncharacterized protein n=1 Tax=Lasiosphaeria hispida TaxID=260671 RepID=A0AAJ0HTK7_9PEZI|nr:hypothetical protein B0T25DRAFT_561713 [Lasiosphaeria hispida]
MAVKNPYNYPKPVRAKLWMGKAPLVAGFSIQSIRALTPIFWEKCLMMSKLWREEMRASGVKTMSFEVLEWRLVLRPRDGVAVKATVL